MQSRCRPAMGTFVEIAILDDGAAPSIVGAIDAAFAAIARVDSLMSFHDPASDLSRINARAAHEEVQVDPWTADVLRQARALFIATDGRFDCAVGSLLVARGLLPRHAFVAGEEIADRGTFADVSVSGDGGVRFARPLCLDLGGIAKGHAVDRAIDALSEAGVASAVVNAGGDLRVLGPIAVPIHVRRPGPARALAYAGDLADGAFASSACFRVAADEGQTPSALVDPIGDRFLDDGRGYSVIAPTCAVADALTKVLAACGTLPAACRERFDARPLVH